MLLLQLLFFFFFHISAVPMHCLVAHLNDIRCFFITGGFLWSGSVDSTIRVWDLASGKCAAVLSAIGGAGGHSDAISCIELVPNVGAEAFIATGSADKTVKVWKTTGGTLMHTCNHTTVITALKAFRDSLGGRITKRSLLYSSCACFHSVFFCCAMRIAGVQVLIVGLMDGTIVVRSCVSMKILFCLDQSICHTKTIWSIVDLGQSCFGTGSDEGNIVVWKINSALVDK